MIPPIEEYLIRHITGEWHTIRVEDLPWGLWIRRYAALPPDANEVDGWAVPERVWFADEAGLRTESIWKWARFVATRPSDDSDSGRSRFNIARAALAPYSDGRHDYADTLWGPRHGWGARWEIGADGFPCYEQNLWRA